MTSVTKTNHPIKACHLQQANAIRSKLMKGAFSVEVDL